MSIESMFVESDLPLVSVIMPVYNVENYVDKAIMSVIDQPYNNIELLICDDYSSDNTYEICKEFSYIYPRIKVLRNSKNKKISYTLNKLISKSRGKYLLRMDGDDISSKDRIINLVNFLESSPEYDLAGCGAHGIDESGNRLARTPVIYNQDLLMKTLHLSSPVLHIWLVKKSVSEDIGNYRNISGVEDYDYLLRLCSSGYKITNLDFDGYSIRIRSGNTASSMGVVQRRLSRFVVKMYKKRLKGEEDGFSSSKIQNISNPSILALVAYKLSNKLTIKAIKYRATGSKLLALMYYLFAAIVSYDQLIYFINKAKIYFISTRFKEIK